MKHCNFKIDRSAESQFAEVSFQITMMVKAPTIAGFFRVFGSDNYSIFFGGQGSRQKTEWRSQHFIDDRVYWKVIVVAASTWLI